MRLSNPIEKPGFFWLPDDPGQQYPGNLHISEAGEVTLKIVHRPTAADSPTLHSSTPFGEEVPRILGIVDNNAVTLQRCVAVEDPFYWLRIIEGYVSESQFRVRAAFIGAPFPDDEPISFTRVDCSFEGLGEWFSISGFRPEIKSDSEPADWSLHYAQPDNISVTLPGGIQLDFVFYPSFALPDYKISKLSSGISQQIHIALHSEHLLPFVDFFNILHRVQAFLCLAMNRVPSLEWIKGYSKDKLDKRNREIATDIFYDDQMQGDQKVTYASMVYMYKDISECFENTIFKWFENYEKIQPAFGLYLSSRIGAYKYLNGIFLSLVQSLETLHRRTTKDTVMEVDEFNKLLASIINAAPIERREFMESKLKYANEISLRTRLKQLMHPFQDLFGTSSERNSLIGNIVLVRNYLTHYDEEGEEKAKHIIDHGLYDVCLKMDALLQLQFIQFTGMAVGRIKSLAHASRALRLRLALGEPDG